LEGLKSDGLVALAGPIANVRFSGKTKDRQLGAESDMGVAQNAAIKAALLQSGFEVPYGDATVEIEGETVEQANSLLRSWQKEAEQIVSQHWSTIEAVATALMSTDLLNERDLDRIVRSRVAHGWGAVVSGSNSRA
jgi:hypothetical protein